MLLGKMCPPLVVHLISRLAVGGLENGLVNLINHMPKNRYRHAIVSLYEPTSFQTRLRDKDIPIFSLHKKDGQDWRVYLRLWKILRILRPAIIHTRNFGTLEFSILSFLTGVPGRVHGEHGRDMYDIDGTTVKYLILRKMVRPFIHRYITVSGDLAEWLRYKVGIPKDKVTHISNGVDVNKFCPRTIHGQPSSPENFPFRNQQMIVGSVGRIQTVKNHLLLVEAFLYLLDVIPNARSRFRLVIVGDGPLRQKLLECLEDANAGDLAWIPGERVDVAEILREIDLFILPSLAEGNSNTILEAMATGLPVIATAVGGNSELVEEGKTGTLVPSNDPVALGNAIKHYLLHPELLRLHGEAGRERVETRFSLDSMVKDYMLAYDLVLGSGETRANLTNWGFQ